MLNEKKKGRFANGLGIALTSLAILIIAFAIYFICLKHKETGTNEGEVDL